MVRDERLSVEVNGNFLQMWQEMGSYFSVCDCGYDFMVLILHWNLYWSGR